MIVHRCDRRQGRRRAMLALALLLALAAGAAGARVRRQADESAGATTEAAPEESGATGDPPGASADAATASPPPSTSTEAPSTAKPAKVKQPPVNFTQVDELFEAVFSEQEVVAKWKHMDKQLTDGVRAILKMIFPHIVSMSQDAKVSGSCSGAMLKWILNLRNLRSWAVKMLDAIGKPSAGILEGSLSMMGNYRQCLSVRAPDEDEIELVDEFREYFRGQYCVLQLRPHLPERPKYYSLNSTIGSLARKSYKYYEKTTYDELAELAMAFNFVHIRADLCVPSLCSRDDIQRVADLLASKVDMRARVARCQVEPPEGAGGAWARLDEQQVLWLALCSALLLLVGLSTLASALLQFRRQTSKGGRLRSLATSMSLYRSVKHITSVQLDRIADSKPTFLYSLRLLVVMWVLLSTFASQLNFQFLRELLHLRDLIMLWPMQLLVNSSLQFDSLVMLTAFTYAYQNINSNLVDLVKYNVAKYSRLAPSIMVLTGLTVLSPLLYVGKSPVWSDFVEQPAQVCRSTGWLNLTFLQNLLSYDQICLPWTWLFCVELQLCVLATPIVYLLNRNFDRQQGKFRMLSLPTLSLVCLALAGCLANLINTYTNQLPPAWFLTFPDKADKVAYHTMHLTRTWSHLTAFSVGLFAGHLCRCQSITTFSGEPYGRRCCDQLIWVTSLLAMGTSIYSTHRWSLEGRAHLESPVSVALYAAVAPLVWALSWALLLFQLTVPNGRNQRSQLADWLTGDAHLVRIARLSFLVYLLHPWVNMLMLGAQEQAIFSSAIMLANTFIGATFITFLLALLLSALVELPCRRLVKKLALGSRRKCTNLGVIARQLNQTGAREATFVDAQKGYS